MTELLIIADDLTGAIDAGVHFAERGLATRIIPDFAPGDFPGGFDEEADVLVINTESRHISAEAASERVADAVRVAVDAGIPLIYKKTDSTLRGNIGAELEALLKATGRKRIPFIPAYPELKRFTRNGIHYVGDVELHRSGFAMDPLEPVSSSYIPEIVSEQTSCETLVLSFPYSLGFPVEEKDRPMILVYDCTSHQDLELIGKSLAEQGLTDLVAGSAAVGLMLSGKMGNPDYQPGNIRMKGPSLIVNGSLNPVTMDQLTRLDSADIRKILLEPGFLNSAEFNVRKARDLIGNEGNELGGGVDILVNSTDPGKNLLRYLRQVHGEHIPPSVYVKASEYMAEFISMLLKQKDFGQVMVTGGDTLMALIHRLKIRAICPVTEMMPGVVISGITINGESKWLITKPGGYGTPDTLNRILKYIEENK